MDALARGAARGTLELAVVRVLPAGNEEEEEGVNAIVEVGGGGKGLRSHTESSSHQRIGSSRCRRPSRAGCSGPMASAEKKSWSTIRWTRRNEMVVMV